MITSETAAAILKLNERRKELEKLQEYMRNINDSEIFSLKGEVSGRPFNLDFPHSIIKEVLKSNLKNTIIKAVDLNNQASIEIKR